MNDIKPTIFLETWRSPVWRICWAVRSFVTVKQFNRLYDYHAHFYGKTANVHTGTNDNSITREELLEAAINHMKGNCVTLQFDLVNCKVAQFDGPPTTPDY